MKIERLYTLSQFVDLMDETPHEELALMFGYKGCAGLSDDEVYFLSYEAIVEYNDFLKQPLKKEMFVCRWNKPNESLKNSSFSDFELYQKQQQRYENDEKKVIFEGKLVTNVTFEFSSGNAYHIDDLMRHKSLLKLAEATDGQLKLKNVEI